MHSGIKSLTFPSGSSYPSAAATAGLNLWIVFTAWLPLLLCRKTQSTIKMPALLKLQVLLSLLREETKRMMNYFWVLLKLKNIPTRAFKKTSIAPFPLFVSNLNSRDFCLVVALADATKKPHLASLVNMPSYWRQLALVAISLIQELPVKFTALHAVLFDF